MSEENYKRIFSKNLNFYLEKFNKNQNDLINDLGLKSSTVSNWCTGQKLPRMNKIQMLADYFGISKSDLIEDPNTIKGEDSELQEYLDYLKNRPELKMLFSVSKDATKEDVEKAVRIIEALRGQGNE